MVCDFYFLQFAAVHESERKSLPMSWQARLG